MQTLNCTNTDIFQVMGNSDKVSNQTQGSDPQSPSPHPAPRLSPVGETWSPKSQSCLQSKLIIRDMVPQTSQPQSIALKARLRPRATFASYAMPSQNSSEEDVEDDYEDVVKESFEKLVDEDYEDYEELADGVDEDFFPANNGIHASGNDRQHSPRILPKPRAQYSPIGEPGPGIRGIDHSDTRDISVSWSRDSDTRATSSFASSAPGNARAFTVPRQARKPSRASGTRIRTSVNKGTSPMVHSSSVSDASLLKRGMTRTSDALIVKRAMGPNDPENLKIVNMVDNLKMRWTEIADQLNKDRVAAGKAAKMTANCVHNRYNRNAPILFEAEGRTFIPIHLRKTHVAAKEEDRFFWDADRDRMLVEAVKAVEAEKWSRVAELVNRHTGGDLTPGGAATRHRLI